MGIPGWQECKPMWTRPSHALVPGQSSQAAEACAGGQLRTEKRRGIGVFVPDETDGVPASGKRLTRFAKNNLGILEGELADRGETIRFKQAEGGSCGAPGQDHYRYETGLEVVDWELPLGKRIF